MMWPDGKRAAFTIIDDTDDAEMPHIAEVYQHLISAGLRTTKTVWVYPPRDSHLFRGDCLVGNPDYLNFIRDLLERGFEIGLHDVGSGDFTREEIIAGLSIFKDLLGFSPEIHINHSYNKSSIYSGDRRFSFPIKSIVRTMYRGYSGFEGDNERSPHFWGDIHKKYIRWNRSFEIDRLNLLDFIKFPYYDSRFSKYCNAFFPASFCPNQDMFCRLLTSDNIDHLIQTGGAAIIYTHFGYYHERGSLDGRFIKVCELLKARSDQIWFAPLGKILHHMAQQTGIHQIGLLSRLRLELECLVTRIKYRYFVPLDDYHYKKSLGMRHRADN